MARVTQKQIAERAGVSQSIVSKVLRGQPPRNMSKDKIDAINQAADELGYKRPAARPEKPAQSKPRRAPQPKFGATPQGNPIHKYGKQWRQRVAADTGLMPQGDFSSLKLGEQRQVMRVLNSIDKDGKRRTELDKKNTKANQAANQLWKGIAIGASAVGIPLSLAGLVNTFTDLVDSSAATARFATTAGIDPDKMLAMTRAAEVFGVDNTGFQNGIASIQSLSTQMQKGENQKLLEPFAALGISRPLGEVQNRALQGDSLGVLKAINDSYQAGDIKTKDLTELMNRLGASAFTSLMTGGDFGSVMAAKPMQGAATSAVELSEKLETLKHKFEDVFIDKFDDINEGLDKFLSWFDDTDFSNLTALFGDLANGISYLLDKMGYQSTQDILEERQQLVKRRDSGDYMGLKAVRLKELDKMLLSRGIDPTAPNVTLSKSVTPPQLKQGAKENGEAVVESARTSRSGVLDINVNVSVNADGQITNEQAQSIAQAVREELGKQMRTEKDKIKEVYQR